jgi:hypothetical protein
MHSTYNLEDGYLGSGTYLRYSIRKYGSENFIVEKLEFCEDADEMAEREKILVTTDFIKDPLCMNLREGGLGGWTKEQQSINGKNANIKMRWLRENDSKWVKVKSEKLSAALHRQYSEGIRVSLLPDWTDRKHTEETKKKMCGHKRQQGKNNSQYNTCWITNGKENKRIKKELLLSIDTGWYRGRV